MMTKNSMAAQYQPQPQYPGYQFPIGTPSSTMPPELHLGQMMQTPNAQQPYPHPQQPYHQPQPQQMQAHVQPQSQETVFTDYVKYQDLLSDVPPLKTKVSFGKFITKTVTINKTDEKTGAVTSSETVNRYRTPIYFNYAPIGRSPVISEFHLQGPRMITETGIQTRVRQKYTSYSIMLKFDPQNKAHNDFLEVLTRFYMCCVDQISITMDNIGMDKFNGASQDTATSTFDFIVYFRTERGKRIEGSKGSWYVDLYNSKIKRTIFTLVTTPGNKPENLEWDVVTNATVDMVPCFHLNYFRSGGDKAKIMTSLDSAIVYKAVKCNDSARNIDAATIDDEDAVNEAKASVEQIRYLNKAAFDVEQPKVSSSDKPTFAALSEPVTNAPVPNLGDAYAMFQPTQTSDAPVNYN